MSGIKDRIGFIIRLLLLLLFSGTIGGAGPIAEGRTFAQEGVVPSRQTKPEPTGADSKLSKELGRMLLRGWRNENQKVNFQPVITKVEAYAGRPYGLGRISFRLRGDDEMVDRSGAVLLSDRENRTFYPVITNTAFQRFLENVAGDRFGAGSPENVHHLWFLFVGDQPLDVSLTGSGFVNVRVPIQVARPKQFNRFVDQWWKGYTDATQKLIEASDYPPIVETYLTAMIGRRLGLQIPQRQKGAPDPLYQTFQLLFNAESIRLERIEDSMLSGIQPEIANLPLPPPIQWTQLVVNNLPPDIEVEKIAGYVPEECFYLRFGNWQNHIWFKKLTEEFGGDLGRMIQMRGFKYKIQSKFLEQLAIESTEFDQLFGGNLIEDVAVIGKDTYVNDGAAIGVMLLAKNTSLLGSNLSSKRKAFARQNARLGVNLETIDHEGHSIEFLSTADNLYRSFYVSSGDCHLITTSLAMAVRFLEAARGVRSLAGSDEFRFARYQLPLEREDTIFVYVSSRFLQEMLAPAHQIELRRRNRVVTDMMLLELGRMVARNEQAVATDLNSLIRSGYLPDGFGYRPDGGSFDIEGEFWMDSLRGRRGYFTPIADLEIGGVTEEEVRWYQSRASFFSDAIKSLDPMLLAIKRYEYQDRIERIVMDGLIAPFGAEKFDWALARLGPPVVEQISSHPNDIIRMQISLKGDQANPGIPMHLLFAGVQDEFEKAPNLRPKSFLQYLDSFRDSPGYLGSWPKAGYLDWLPGLGRSGMDAQGFSYSRLLRLYRMEWQDFSVIAFDRQRLENLKPYLLVEKAQRPAQLRLHVGDLANSKLRNWANGISFERSWQTSIANVRFLNLLVQQFRLRPEQARDIAETMLDVDLICSLNGNYQVLPLASGREVWISDAWPDFASPTLPETHVSPLLQWFRGVELEVSKTDTQYTLHGYLDIERQDVGTKLPSFELFKGFGNFLGGGGKSKD